MNRRKFVGSAALVALGPFASQLLSGCTSENSAPETALRALSSHDMQTLFAVSRALFPHERAPDQPYLDVVTALDNAAAESGEIQKLLQSAVNGLDSAADGDWLSATPERKVAILESQQAEAYFGVVLNTAIDTIYRDRDIWALVGYEGSSLEHGGYVNRGFDDIGWLPDSPVEAAAE